MPEPIVLIPGLMCTAELFAPQVEAFCEDRGVIVADHTQADTMQEIARHILASAPERFALAGQSMGVYLSLEIMAQAPERVTRLALLDSKARPDTPEQTAGRAALLAMADKGRFLEITSEVLIHRLVAPGRADDPVLHGILMGMAGDTGEAAFRRQMNAIMNRPDYRPGLASINCPTLVLTGELDVITPPDCAREMAAGIAAAELALLPGCGHLATLEAPDAVNAALAHWLAAEV